MRIAHPCSENLPGMRRTPGGVHCGKCDRDVLDLRRVPKKRALALLSEARLASDGRVCAWVRATENGEPVFTPDPSLLSRFVMPAVAATALAACGTSATAPPPSVPVAWTQPSESVPQSSGGNTNAPPATVVATVIATPRAPIQPASNVQPVTVEMAGDVAF